MRQAPSVSAVPGNGSERTSAPSFVNSGRGRLAIALGTGVAAFSAAGCEELEIFNLNTPQGDMTYVVPAPQDQETTTSEGGSGGTGGTGGSETGGGGTGGTETGGGGTGGSINPCDGQTLEALAAADCVAGEDCSVSVSLPEGHPDKAYDGLTIDFKGATVMTDTRVAVKKMTVPYPAGYTPVGNLKAFEVVTVDPVQPLVENESGQCVPNGVSMNEAMMQNNPSMQPQVTSPDGVYATVMGRKLPDSPSVLPVDFSGGNTSFQMDGIKGRDYAFANSAPNVQASAKRDASGFITVDITGTTDEGQGEAAILEKLGLASDELSFEKVMGETGKFKSSTQSPLSSLNVTVNGLNKDLMTDSASAVLMVEETDLCEGVDTNGNGTCDPVTGEVTCDPGFMNDGSIANTADCDACDDSGAYNNDYPVCSPDVTPPGAPVITTNFGQPMLIQQSDFVLDGTTDLDTNEISIRANDVTCLSAPCPPPAQVFDWTSLNYPPNVADWHYDGVIPVDHAYEFCLRAKDKANNVGPESCIIVAREF